MNEMGQMDGMDAGTSPDQGGAGQSAGQQGYVDQGQQGAGQGQQAAQQLLAGKYRTAQELEKAYSELNKRFSQQGDEVGKWRQWHQSWEPYLKPFNYDPQAFVQTLRRAQAADQRGDHQGAQQLRQQAQAQKQWADALTPQEQESWLRDHVSGQVQPVQQQMQQGFRELAERGTAYINNYMSLALRAMEKKFENPQLDLNKMLSEAVNIASGQYDPLEWSYRIQTAEAPDALEARIRQKVEAEFAEKAKNASLTTFAGAGGPTSQRPLRPGTRSAGSGQTPGAAAATTNPGGGLSRAAESAAIADAKERFVRKSKNWNLAGE